MLENKEAERKREIKFRPLLLIYEHLRFSRISILWCISFTYIYFTLFVTFHCLGGCYSGSVIVESTVMSH